MINIEKYTIAIVDELMYAETELKKIKHDINSHLRILGDKRRNEDNSSCFLFF